MKVLLVNQCFHPDVVSTAQHLTDLAVRLAELGHDVTVICSSRGYDNPDARFAKREVWKRVTVIRVPCSGLGKKAKWRRAVDFGSFMISCAFRMISLSRFDLVVGMTSPPLISFLAALLAQLKGSRFVFWVMDLNPDEAIAAGWLRTDSAVSKALAAILMYSLRRAEKILVLDRFMKQRIADKGIPEQKLIIIPPWSHDDNVRYDLAGRLGFRASHNLDDKYVVMYSGNHSPCHPLDTLLCAAHRLAEHPKVAFCFVGGGGEFAKVKSFVESHGLTNVICLPYEPMDKLAASLSAADLHVVVMGEPFIGIVHPCKVYNILSIGARFLYIGPSESHVVDIMRRVKSNGMARIAGHGEVDIVVQHILEAATQSIFGANRKASVAFANAFSKEVLLSRMVELLESSPGEVSAYGCGVAKAKLIH